MNILYTYFSLCLITAINSKRTRTKSETKHSKRTLEEYEQKKTNLLQQESLSFLGGKLRLCKEEKLVNNILMNHKENKVNQSFYHPERFNFSKHYFTYKDYIKQSKVYQIIKRMPKGAALHLHGTYLMDGDYLLNLTYEQNLYACYVSDNLTLKFSDTVPEGPCPVRWTLLSELRNAANDITAFDGKLRKFFTLDTDNYNLNADVNTVWSQFSSIHPSVKSLIIYRPIREKFIYDTLQKFYDDNVLYIEIRSSMVRLHELNGTLHDQTYFIKLHKYVTERFIKDHPDFIGMKIIVNGHRHSAEIKDVQELLNTTMIAKAEFPQMVAGFDLVGQEDLGKPLSDFLPALLEVKDKVNFYFHAGETNWFGTSSDENLLDAVLLGSKRIGHGCALIKHPVLMSLIKKEDIAVEVNVISNAVLALVSDVRHHPLATYLASGLPVVLSSDDPGVWGADPLSHDFYISFIAVASRHADLRLLKQLAINSIKYSSLENKRKTRLSKVFNRKWNKFLKEIIAETEDS